MSDAFHSNSSKRKVGKIPLPIEPAGLKSIVSTNKEEIAVGMGDIGKTDISDWPNSDCI